MDKLNTFFEKHGLKIIAILLVLTYSKSCSMDSELTLLKKATRINTEVMKKTIKIEGLRSELRMIQATDRKLIDVNRQNQIEIEIKTLEAVN